MVHQAFALFQVNFVGQRGLGIAAELFQIAHQKNAQHQINNGKKDDSQPGTGRNMNPGQLGRRAHGEGIGDGGGKAEAGRHQAGPQPHHRIHLHREHEGNDQRQQGNQFLKHTNETAKEHKEQHRDADHRPPPDPGAGA